MALEKEYVEITKSGDGSVNELTTEQTLLAYLQSSGSRIQITDKEAEMILGYFEGHGYMVGEKNGQFLRGDLCDRDDAIPWEDYTVDDMIDAVCEWNYELILEDEASENHDASDMRYQKLKADEAVLDRLFEQTKYNVAVMELAEVLADQFISNLNLDNDKSKMESTKNIDNAVHELSSQIQTYGSGGRSR